MRHEGSIDERLNLIRHPAERSDGGVRPLRGNVVPFGERCEGHASDVGVGIAGHAHDRIDIESRPR